MYRRFRESEWRHDPEGLLTASTRREAPATAVEAWNPGRRGLPRRQPLRKVATTDYAHTV